jgi:hypothetical protein
MYRTKKSPLELIDYVYQTTGIDKTLSPFRDGVLLHLGLEFYAFFIEKYGRIKIRVYEYKVIDQIKLNTFDPSYKIC